MDKKLRLKKINKRKQKVIKLLKRAFLIVGVSVFVNWTGISYSAQFKLFLVLFAMFVLGIGFLVLISYLDKKKQEKEVEEYSKKLKGINQEELIHILKSKGSGEI